MLNEGELDLLMKDSKLKPQVLPTYFDICNGLDGSLERMLMEICEVADEAVRNGSQLLILSDRTKELVSNSLLCILLFSTFIFIFNLSVIVQFNLIEFFS